MTTQRAGHGTPNARRLARTAMRAAGTTVAGLLLVAFAAITVGPRVLPYQTFFVRSGSMRPTMPVGSLAIYTPIAAKSVRVGEVIAFARPTAVGGLVTHRVIAIEHTSHGDQLQTKGDANANPDPWRVAMTGTGWKLTHVLPGVGYAAGYLSQGALRLGLLTLVAMITAARLLAGIWRRPRPALSA